MEKALTRQERREIKDLVYQCANYDRPDKLCLLTDMVDKPCDCPMLTIKTAGKVCSYFRNAVLPLNPALEGALTYTPVAKRVCVLCGNEFVPKNNRQQYCNEKCKHKGRLAAERERYRRGKETA